VPAVYYVNIDHIVDIGNRRTKASQVLSFPSGKESRSWISELESAIRKIIQAL
jgi:hypothetical protein